ncbi:hypothetical protein MUP01_12790 [Candidatus Bathyarchaeota archaeon]|nr:hypothetical protein [Candidatus Bathyarchaeota archaeon]
MRLFDDVAHQAANLLQSLNGKCPHCGATLENVGGRRSFFEVECPTCHLHLEVTTRNNNRVLYAVMFIGLAFFVGALVHAIL